MKIFEYFDRVYKIDPAARQALEALIREKTYARNETIQEIGSRCKTIYIVKNGGARIFYYKDGHDITEHFAFENEMMVRVESLFTGQPTMKGIQALEASTIISIDAYALFQLYDKYHDIERLFRLLFEKEHVNTVKRLESLQFQNATERYLELLQSTDLVHKIPLKHIASYLGITQVSLSRIRAGLK